ncbi:MAG: outer membrane protein assembly factor BamA [Deltaproteobacteria bacterium]|nr:outer membrane protein assembly factor BamA [Deltaproteobacteria bacterium]
MNRPVLAWLVLLAAWLLVVGPVRAQAPAPAQGRVEQVVVSGLKRIEEAVIQARIELRPGEELSGWKVQRDLRSIYRSGLVEDVRVDLSPAAGGNGVVVTFQVVEKPAIREVKIRGNKKIEEEDIRAVVDIPVFAVLNEADVAANIQRIRDLYLEKGYFLAEVEREVQDVGNHQVELTFQITENKKVRVARVDFSGNDHVPDRKIRKFMQTRPAGVAPWLTSTGNFRQEDLDNDVYVVRSVFLEEGYVDVRVDPPKVYLSPDKRHILVHMHLEEGPRYRIGKIDVQGDFVPEEGLTKESVMRLVEGESLDDVEHDNRKALGDSVRWFPGSVGYGQESTAAAREPVRTGDWFQLSRIQTLLQETSDLYSDQGYAFANVVPLTDSDPERQTVDLTLQIERGERITVGRIHITGNDPTYDKVVRREIPLNEAETYSGRALKEARARLQRLGFFESVDITTPKGATPDSLDVQVQVTEQPTGTFSVQAGFSNLDNFIFGLNVAKNNFLGLGYVMAAAANVSSYRQQGNVSLFDPYFLDTRWTLRVNGYAYSRQYLEDEYQRGGSFAVGRYLDPRDDVLLTADYTIEDSGLHSIDAYKKRLLGGQLYRSGLTSTLGLNLNVDKRNNRILPTRGYYASLASELSGGFRVNDQQVLSLLGGDFGMWETRLNFRYFKPLVPEGEWIVFRYNLTAGAIRSTDGSVVPYIHRYRAGGINSVRGFDWYSLGPSIRATGVRSETTSYIGNYFSGADDPSAPDDRLVVGGTETLINNVELEVPIVKSAGITAVLFFDAGNAFGDPWGEGHMSLRGLRTSWGFGLRWFSPLGPLRFEQGFPIDPQPGERSSVFDFSIGSFF